MLNVYVHMCAWVLGFQMWVIMASLYSAGDGTQGFAHAKQTPWPQNYVLGLPHSWQIFYFLLKSTLIIELPGFLKDFSVVVLPIWKQRIH